MQRATSNDEFEVKKFLHSWLGCRKYRPPVYKPADFRGAQMPGGLIFCYQVRSHSFPTIMGYGRDTSKKGAMTEAARDYCLKLVKAGNMKEAELPFKKSYGNSVDIDRYSTSRTNTHQRLVGTPVQHLIHEVTDLNAVGDGGWNLNNCQAQFDKFIQATNIVVSSRIIPVGLGCNSSVIVEISFSLQEAKERAKIDLYAREEGTTEEKARAKCALKVVQKLYEMKLIGPANRCREQISSQPNVRRTSESPPAFSCTSASPVSVSALPSVMRPNAIKKPFYYDRDAVKRVGNKYNSSATQQRSVEATSYAREAALDNFTQRIPYKKSLEYLPHYPRQEPIDEEPIAIYQEPSVDQPLMFYQEQTDEVAIDQEPIDENSLTSSEVPNVEQPLASGYQSGRYWTSSGPVLPADQ